MIKVLNSKNIKWDNLLTSNPDEGDILQSLEFAKVKKSQGWDNFLISFQVEDNVFYAMVLKKNIPLFGQIWYIPRGPGLTSQRDIGEFIKQIRLFAKNEKVLFIKIEPPIEKASGLAETGLLKSKNIQPNSSTVIINLQPSEDTILASFRQRARRAIRKAEKAGIKVEKVEPISDNLNEFFSLYKKTGQRAGFYIRSETYYINFWNIFSGANKGSLYFARLNQKVVAAAYILNNKTSGLYKDGASDRSSMAEGAPYLLQWEIIKDLKKAGLDSYDLHGVPPEDEINDKTHPYYSLGVFKTAFSSQITTYIGAYDIICRPIFYRLWLLVGLRLVQAYSHKIRKTTFY